MDYFGGDTSDAWESVWKISGSPKLSHFVRRACVGALAMKGKLYERHVTEDATCFDCVGASESILHAIFHFSLVSDAWSNSLFCHYIMDGPITSFMDFSKVGIAMK